MKHDKKVSKSIFGKNIFNFMHRYFKRGFARFDPQAPDSFKTLQTAVHHQDWTLAVELAEDLLGQRKPLSAEQAGGSKQASVSAAYVLGLYKMRNYRGCIDFFQKNQKVLLSHAKSAEIKRAVAAYCQSLLCLGRSQEVIEFADSLPRKFLRMPAVSGVFQGALLSENRQRSLCLAQNSISHAKKNIHIYLGKLVFACLACGATAEQALHIMRNWKSIKLESGEESPLNNFLEAALASRLNQTDQVLGALNKVLKQNALAPLTLKNLDQGVTVDNFECSGCAPKHSAILISVIMPVYNSQEYLSTAIASVLGQTYNNLELIIIDDGSTDSTLEIVRAWQKCDARIRVISLAENRGPYIARNIGLTQARGQYITTHDSDDWSHPQRLSTQLDWLLVEGAEACISGWFRTDDTGRILLFAGGKVLHNDPTSLFFSRKVLQTLGYFDQVRASGDNEFKHRIISFYGKKALIDRSGDLFLAVGRWREGSLTRSDEFGYDLFGNNPIRDDYRRMFRLWHRKCQLINQAPYMEFDPKQRKFQAPQEICINSAVPDYQVFEPLQRSSSSGADHEKK